MSELPLRNLLSGMLAVACSVVLASRLAAAEPAALPRADGDLVFSRAGLSVRARLRFVVSGRPWVECAEESRVRFVEGLFAWLDADGDGGLSEAEAKRTPPPAPLRLSDAPDAEEVHFAFNFRVMDEDSDGKVTPQELSEYFRNFGGAPLRAVKQAARQPVSVDRELFMRLDRDRDGSLTLDELNRAERLFTLDRDNDGLVAASEISSEGTAPGREEFVARTRSKATPAPAEALAISWESAGELPADFEVVAELGADWADEVPLRIIASRERKDASARLDSDVLIIQAAGARVELRVAPPSLRTESQHISTLRREFAATNDGRGDRVLADARLPEFLRRSFDLLDRNGDRVVERRELERFLEQVIPLQSLCESGRMTINLGPGRSGLFALLDRNDDGYLGPRELRALPQLGREFDTNGDGRLTPDEVPTSCVVVIRRGALIAPYEAQNSSTGGPPWFKRLDRNGDGDLSAAEFPGRVELFNQLDSDHDGLIGLKEALHADRRFRGSPLEKENQ